VTKVRVELDFSLMAVGVPIAGSGKVAIIDNVARSNSIGVNGNSGESSCFPSFSIFPKSIAFNPNGAGWFESAVENIRFISIGLHVPYDGMKIFDF